MFSQLKYSAAIPQTASLTLYRALALLHALMQEDRTKQELLDIIAQIEHGKTSNLNESLRITLTTLKNFGCIISRPTEKNNYKYILEYNPFSINMSKYETRLLHSLRKKIAERNDYELILNINSLFDKIFTRVKNKSLKDVIKSREPFVLMDKTVLNTLISGELFGKVVALKYVSAKKGLEKLYFIPERLMMKNSRLYVWGFSFKYSEYSYLNAEKIKEISTIQNDDDSLKLPVFKARYTIVGQSAQEFQREENEEIILSEENKLVVEVKVNNTFMFLQRLLSFGTDLRTLEPEFIRKQLLTKLYKMKERYQR